MNNNDIYELMKENNSFYVFNIDELKKRINLIKSFLPDNTKLCYAIKANPFILNYIKDEDLLFEVCSPGELSICEKYNVSPDKIVFSGVCKTQEDIKRAYSLKVKTITLESPKHCQLLCNVLSEIKTEDLHQQEVILRLSSGNQFGMCAGDLEACIKTLKQYPDIDIRGIHYFSGTQKKLKKIQEEITFVEEYCSQLKDNCDIRFESIEYGPGLSFNYFAAEPEENNFDEIKAFSCMIENSKYDYVIELGRYIASTCGEYYTTIMDIKNTDGNSYCILDGGINHINYYGQMMGMKVPPVMHLKKTEKGDVKKYTICGSLCTTADIVLRELELNSPEIGDVLCFKNIGAYSITEGIYLFLSHAFPSVYVINNGSISKIRGKKESYEINS